MQTAYNIIAYKDKPRLGTAVEMLKTTQEIERRLEDVCSFSDFSLLHLSESWINCAFVFNFCLEWILISLFCVPLFPILSSFNCHYFLIFLSACIKSLISFL